MESEQKTEESIGEEVKMGTIEKVLNQKQADYLFFLTESSINEDDLLKVIEVTKGVDPKPKSEVVLIINSGGGNVYAAVKIMDVLRTKYERITVVVMLSAKSAATMMALGADEIIMAAQSELGPLDAPINHPHLDGEGLSALDVLHSINLLEERAFKNLTDFADRILNSQGLSKEHAFSLAKEMSLGLTLPILSKEDPRMINKCQRLLSRSTEYGTELLCANMLKKYSPEVRRKLADYIMNFLVWDCSDHGFAIRRHVARDHFIEVKDAEDFVQWDRLWRFFVRKRDEIRRQQSDKFINLVPWDIISPTTSSASI